MEETNFGAQVTLPTGKKVEIHTPTSEASSTKALKLKVEGAKAKGGEAIAGAYWKAGDLAMTENDVIYLTGDQTDFTTLHHEKGHLVVNAMRNLLTPDELVTIGLPATGPINVDLEEAVMGEFEQYAYTRTPSEENPMSPLDKAFQKVIDFAHGAKSLMTGEETQRQVFEKMRTGEVLTREGAPRLPGETDAMYQRRTQEPEWYKPVRTTKSGRIVGAPWSHNAPGAFGSLVRKMFNAASDIHEVNPEQANWYDGPTAESIRDRYGLKKGKGGKWEGDTAGANRFMMALALWSARMPVERNARAAVQAIALQAKGERPLVAGAVVSAETMADRFEAAVGAPEFGSMLAGVGPKIDSFYWDLHNAVYGIKDSRNATIDTHVIQAMGLMKESGLPYESLEGPQYGWARAILEEATKQFNSAYGTDYSVRQVQALIWEWNRAGQQAVKLEPENFSKYLKEAARYQKKRPGETHKWSTIADIDGKDRSKDVLAVALSEAKEVRQLLPEDRVWLMPNGEAVFLEEWELHENRAGMIVNRAGVINRDRITNERFGGSINAVRFHGLQARYEANRETQYAVEIFRPMTEEQVDMLRKSLGTRRRIIADLSDPETGVVLSYAFGKGEEGLNALIAESKKAYKGGKAQQVARFQTKDVDSAARAIRGFPDQIETSKLQGLLDRFAGGTLVENLGLGDLLTGKKFVSRGDLLGRMAASRLAMYQTRTPGPKGLTVNFTDSEVSSLGEELLRRVRQVGIHADQRPDPEEGAGDDRLGEDELETFLNHDPYTAWPDSAHQVAAR